MLKKVSVMLIVLMLGACASEPTDKGFTGTGNFDTAEAAKTRVSLGLTYLKNGNFSQAKFNLDKALEFDPRSGQANYAMAFYYQQVGEIKRAHEYYKQAISLSKKDPDVLNSYGAFLCKQGDYDSAKSYFLEAVDNKSYVSTAETYENLAICSQSQGKTDEAIDYFNSALNHQPTRASSLLYLTQLYTESSQWDLAKKTLWKYERNATISADSLWLAFQIARGQQDLRGSLEYAELLKRLHPNHDNTAKALATLGKFQPDMTVTQKTRPTFTAPSTKNDDVVQTSESTKPMRVIEPTPVVNAPVSNEASETPTEATTASSVEETERALQDALNKPVNFALPTTQVEATQVQALDSQADIVNNVSTPFHIVQPKENLYRISLKYNVKIKKLLEWNKLESEESILIGTKLWVRDPNSNE